MATRKTQEERKAESTQALLEAAVRLIGQEGSVRTSLARIGAEAGFSRGIVNERFGTKQALIEGLVDDVQQQIREGVLESARGQEQGLDSLLAVVDAYLANVARSEDTGRAFYVMMAESIGPVPELREKFAQATRELRDFLGREIQAGIDGGDIRPSIDPAAQAALIVGSLRGLTLQRLVDPSGVDIDTTRRQLLENLERTLRHRQE
ncbi:MAG: TetR family transcriptional regulator [Deltaproteobacteria bacterium]|jgi:AcrR family transcriptional regulator|nr:TetR family transcriptional regulator [Deltaproteobacteria bacterium]